MNKGFTLIESIVVITIIVVLSSVILFTVNQYIAKGKDASVKGNLVILVAAGETFFNGPGNDSYEGFCSSNVVLKAVEQISKPATELDCSSGATPGLCCYVETLTGTYNSWAACAQLFTNNLWAYCIDSRGVKQEICNSSCTPTINKCPDDNLNSCSS